MKLVSMCIYKINNVCLATPYVHEVWVSGRGVLTRDMVRYALSCVVPASCSVHANVGDGFTFFRVTPSGIRKQ